MRSSYGLDRLDVAPDGTHQVADAGLRLPATLAQQLEPVAGHRGLRVMTDSDGTRGSPVTGVASHEGLTPGRITLAARHASHHRLDWASLTHDLQRQVAVRTAGPDRGAPN